MTWLIGIEMEMTSSTSAVWVTEIVGSPAFADNQKGDNKRPKQTCYFEPHVYVDACKPTKTTAGNRMLIKVDDLFRRIDQVSGSATRPGLMHGRFVGKGSSSA